MAANIQSAYNWAVTTCNAPNVGYSDSTNRRQGITKNGITYYDCSSFISKSLTVGGFFKNNPWFTTATMEGTLLKLGFQQIPIEAEWKAGDILWRRGHTEMVYKNRVTMGAHTNVNRALADQVSISKFESKPSNWTHCYRWLGGAIPSDLNTNISIYVLCALAGNAMQESSMNPATVSGSGYTGLWQWGSTRRDAFFAWCDENRLPWYDGMAQCMYLIVEDFWINHGTPYNNLTAFLTSDSTDIDALTKAFFDCWEIAGDTTLAKRQQYAHEAYDYIMLHKDDADITEWAWSTDHITEDAAKRNYVMMYRSLMLGSEDDGGEGWSGTLRNGCARELYRRRYIWR